MSELHFDGPPKNGKQIEVTSGHPQPTPYHASVWVNGVLEQTRKFATQMEAETFKQQEIIR